MYEQSENMLIQKLKNSKEQTLPLLVAFIVVKRVK